ncbi:jerky-like protein [Trichonephila clavipes]|uniref:Jerky-like protein n=1 Tax=Trichonephila clavipes TaxID=2585209 RepID=A0A8X6RRU7_TRICX|nr:jerky-like protein [Trichonephila clavipes]
MGYGNCGLKANHCIVIRILPTFKETFLQSVVEEGYSRDDVYNIDETGVNRKALPRKPLASKRECTAPGFRVSGERVTAMVSANALPLLVIGKSKKPCSFKNVSCLPTLYKAQTSVWMNSALFSEWYSKDSYFQPQETL